MLTLEILERLRTRFLEFDGKFLLVGHRLSNLRDGEEEKR